MNVSRSMVRVWCDNLDRNSTGIPTREIHYRYVYLYFSFCI